MKWINSCWCVGAHWHSSSLSATFFWPSLGFFSFPPSSRTDFYPWERKADFLSSFEDVAPHTCAQDAQPERPPVHMSWVHVPESIYSNELTLPLHTWRRPCHCTARQEPQQCPGLWLQASMQEERWLMEPQVPMGKKSLHPFARCHFPESVKRVWLVSPRRGAKKERHCCRRFGPNQDKLVLFHCVLVFPCENRTQSN